MKTLALCQALSLGFLQLGFGIGFPSPTLKELLGLNLLDDYTFPIFTSAFVLGLALGVILSIPCSKYLGRKLSVTISSIIIMFGLLLIASAINPTYLIAGRLFHGIGAGLSCNVLIVYIAEISPPCTRGLLSSFEGIYDATGSLIVYVIGSLISFRWLAIVGLVMSALHTSLVLFVPESPTWLYERGLEKRAKSNLIALRREESEVLEECSSMSIALQANGKSKLFTVQFIKVILVKYRLKALAIGILLAIGSTNSGIDIIYSYTSTLLEANNGIDPNFVAIGVTIFGVFGAVAIIIIVDRIGRKPLLLASAVIVTISHISLTCYFLLDENIFGCSVLEGESNISLCKWIIIWPGISLAVFSIGFQIGWGSVVYVIFGEIFPIRIKEFGAGISMSVLNIWSIIILIAFSYIRGVIGNGYTFLFLALINLFSCIFIILFLPETKGLKADETE